MNSSLLLSSNKGTYALILYLKSENIVKVGQLGEFKFPRGYYVYIGSAFGPGGLKARLKHHLHVSAKPRWHIDYLKELATIKESWISESKSKREHDWAAMLFNIEGAAIPAPGFGSSDCQCSSHLFAFKKRPSFQQFRELVLEKPCGGQKIFKVAF